MQPSEPSEVTLPLRWPSTECLGRGLAAVHARICVPSPGCLGPVRPGLTHALRFLPTEAAAGLTHRGRVLLQGQAPQRDMKSRRGWPGAASAAQAAAGRMKIKRNRKGTERYNRGFQTRGLWTRGSPRPWSPRPPALGALNTDTGTAGGVSAGCTAPCSSPFPDARLMKDAEITSFSRTTLRLNQALGHAGGCFPQGHCVPVPCPREVPVTPHPHPRCPVAASRGGATVRASPAEEDGLSRHGAPGCAEAQRGVGAPEAGGPGSIWRRGAGYVSEEASHLTCS